MHALLCICYCFARLIGLFKITWLSLLYKFVKFFIYFLFLSDVGPTLETLDYTIRIGSTPTVLYFDLYLYCAYAAHYVYLKITNDLPTFTSYYAFVIVCRIWLAYFRSHDYFSNFVHKLTRFFYSFYVSLQNVILRFLYRQYTNVLYFDLYHSTLRLYSTLYV